MMLMAIIAAASSCISGYALYLAKDVDDRLSEYDELFDADGCYERIKGMPTPSGPRPI